MTLAYDDPIRLAVRFNTQVFTTALSSPFHDLGWLKSPPAFPITLSDDLALVVKSGFGTKERIPGWLDMHRSLNLSNVLLVGDFASPLGISFSVDGYHVAVHDMVEEMKDVGSIPKDMVHSRLRKYADLKSAVSRGDEDAARALSRSFGWELDALKVCFPPYLEYR